MLLTLITAKGLALVDAILEYFAYATPTGELNICGGRWITYNAGLTACGTTFVQDLVALLAGLTHLAPQLMMGLFAQGGPVTG